MWLKKNIRKEIRITLLLIIAFLAAMIAGCRAAQPETLATKTEPPAATETTLAPTPTLEPLAAVVNGEKLVLMDFEREVDRYILATGLENKASLTEEERSAILDSIVEEMLLSQSAIEAGFELAEGELQQRLSDLESAAGGTEELSTWIDQNGYTREEFTESLRRSIAAAWERDRIINQVPEAVEQVHILQILVKDEKLAKDIYGNLQSGADFATLAYRYEPLTGGDLGWFPKGFILLPELEEAAFTLQPGEYSEVIATSYGFHILALIERENQRSLPPEMRMALQRQHLQEWLQVRRRESQIEITLP